MEGGTGRIVAHADCRFWREWYRDGLPEIFLGVFLLDGAGIFAAGAHFAWIFGVVLPVLLLGGRKLLPSALFALKSRVSDPRTGYVRPRQPKLFQTRRSQLALVAVGGISGPLIKAFGSRVVGWLYEAAPPFQWWWPALVTGSGAVAGFVTWRQYESIRFLWVGLAALVGALWGPLLQWPATDSFALAYAVQGAAWLVSGTLTLRSFLRSHPRPVEG